MTDQNAEILCTLYQSLDDELTTLGSIFLYGSLAIVISLLAAAVGYYLSESTRQIDVRLAPGAPSGLVIILGFFTLSGTLVEWVSTNIIKVGYRQLRVERQLVQLLPQIPLSTFPQHDVFCVDLGSQVPKLVAFSNRMLFPSFVRESLYHRNATLVLALIAGFSSATFGFTLWARMGLSTGGSAFSWCKAFLPGLILAVISAMFQIAVIRLWK